MNAVDDIERRIRADCFEPLGWLEGGHDDVPAGNTVVLIGNAGAAMFDRFARERDPRIDLLDDWTCDVLGPLADGLGARAIYPFDTPAPPFLTWARRARAGHTSPLGLNIHSGFGLWHAFRAAFIFDRGIDLPTRVQPMHPCESCSGRPCLSACPVGAFTGDTYDVEACAGHLASPEGAPCRLHGCLARRACPVGQRYRYAPGQMRFHMVAFMKARGIGPEAM